MKRKPMLQFFLSAIMTMAMVSLTVQCATGTASEITIGAESDARDMTERNLVIKKTFASVDVSTGVRLFYTVGTTNKVRVIGPEEQVENTVVTIENGNLKVYIDHDYLNTRKRMNPNVSVYVTAPAFSGIKATSGSIVNLETEISVTGDFNLASSSGAIFKADNGLKCGTLNVDNSSGAIAEINGLKATKVKVDLSSGSILSVKGTAATLDVDVSSGAIANLEGLQADKGKVEASSGAIVNIRKGSFAVSSSSGAIIHRK